MSTARSFTKQSLASSEAVNPAHGAFPEIAPVTAPARRISSLYDWLREPSSFPKSFGRERLELTHDAIYVVGAREVYKFPRSELLQSPKESMRRRWNRAVFEIDAHAILAPQLYVGVLPFELVHGIPVWTSDEPLQGEALRQMPKGTTAYCFVLRRLFRARSLFRSAGSKPERNSSQSLDSVEPTTGEQSDQRAHLTDFAVQYAVDNVATRCAQRLARHHCARRKNKSSESTGTARSIRHLSELERFIRRHTFRNDDMRAAYQGLQFFDGFVLAEAFGRYHRELRELAPELLRRENEWSLSKVFVRPEKALIGANPSRRSASTPELFMLPELIVGSEKARKELTHDPLFEAASFYRAFETYETASAARFIQAYSKQTESFSPRMFRLFRLYACLREYALLSMKGGAIRSQSMRKRPLEELRNSLLRALFQPESPTLIVLGGTSEFRDQFVGVWLARLFQMQTVPGILEILAGESGIKTLAPPLREAAVRRRMYEAADRYLSEGKSVVFEDAPIELVSELKPLAALHGAQTHAFFFDSLTEISESPRDQILREVLSIDVPRLRGKNVDDVVLLECSAQREENLAALLSSMRLQTASSAPVRN